MNLKEIKKTLETEVKIIDLFEKLPETRRRNLAQLLQKSEVVPKRKDGPRRKLVRPIVSTPTSGRLNLYPLSPGKSKAFKTFNPKNLPTLREDAVSQRIAHWFHNHLKYNDPFWNVLQKMVDIVQENKKGIYPYWRVRVLTYPLMSAYVAYRRWQGLEWTTMAKTIGVSANFIDKFKRGCGTVYRLMIDNGFNLPEYLKPTDAV